MLCRSPSLAPSTSTSRWVRAARMIDVPKPDPKLQAVALRLAADRVAAGQPLAPDLAEALAREVDRHPEDAEQLEAFAALEAERVPPWHLEVLDERDAEEGGDTW